MDSELKPCPNPWCEALEREGDFSPRVHYSNFCLVYVACTSCGMAGPTRQNEIEAIAAWNTRAETPDERQAAIVEALRKDAHLCDCFAYSYGECACGAWGSDPEERSFKRKSVEDVADWIESGEWRRK